MRFFLLLCTLIMVSSSLVIAQETKEDEEKKNTNLFQGDFQNSPTYIRSNEMVLHANTRRVEYLGNVEVLHEDMRMTCDRIEAFYTPENEIDKILAYDNIFITRETGTQARSEHAIYEKATETITLTINPEVQENGSIVTADKIRIFLLEDRSEAEGQVRVKIVQANPNEEQAADGTGSTTPSGETATREAPTPVPTPE